MKKILKKICENKKIIIMVDELDRCKPTFAIELLEVIKHLFDVENMVFIFALDIKQLSYSVQSVYGTGIDSTGYLCRFFDYISKLPKIDINTIYSNFLIFEKMELSNITNIIAYKLYLLLMIIKYKDLKCFEKIFIFNENISEESCIKKIQKNNNKNTNDYSELLSVLNSKNEIISNMYCRKGV